MMLNTTKRCITQRPLSHQEFDENWQKVEDAINSKLPRNKYQIQDVAVQRIYDDQGIIATFTVSVAIVELLEALPGFKGWVTLGTQIIGAGTDTSNWIGSDNGPIGVDISFQARVYSTQADWPWPITVYVEDEKGNYTEPYTFTPTFD